MPTLKQLQKHFDKMLHDDMTLSLESIIETTAGKAEIAPEVLKGAMAGDGMVRLNEDIIRKIFEILGIKDEQEPPGEPEPCPPGEKRNDAGDCEKMEEPPGESKSTIREQLETTFGKDDLKNHFAEVLKLIDGAKDAETKKYLSEIFRKVFETIPAIIKAEQGDKITEYTKKVEQLDKQIKASEKKVAEIQAAMKKVPKLTEALEKAGQIQRGKGLYEQSTKTDKTKTNELEEMSLSDFHRDKIPNFD